MQIPPNESFWRAFGVEIQILGPDSLPPPICDTKPWFCVAGGGGQAPPPLRHKTMVLCNANLVCAIVESCVVGTGGLAPPLLRHKTMVLCLKRGGGKFLLPKTRSHPNWL